MGKKTKTKIPLIIAAAIIIIIIVIALVILLDDKKEEGENAEPEGEASAIAEEIYGFFAEIKEIKDKTLTLEGWIAMANPEEKPIKATIKAKVTDQTRIVKLKFPEIPEGSDEPIYPEETLMSFDALKIGDKIDISTIDNISENIKNKTEFIVNDIFITIK